MEVEELYAKIEKWLKRKGCRIHTCGAPYSLEFFYEGFYGMIETKKHANSPWRPGQKENIEFFNNWSWARGVWSENWPEIQKELDEILK